MKQDFAFFKIGFGTWQIGGRTEADPNNDDKADIEAIQYAIKKGIRHIDTSAFYANGKAEELVGLAIKPFKREDLFISSKVFENLGYEDVIASCKNSLRRLGLSYLDLFYLHFPNHSIPYTETARALNELLDAGLIRNVGICNATVDTIKAYQKHLKVPFFAVQNHYNLIVRESVVKGVTKYCKQNGIHFIAWRPIQLPIPKLNIASLAATGAYPILDKMAAKYNKTNAQIAVRWLIQQDNVHILFKSTNPKHIDEIVAAESFELSHQDFLDLEKNFPLQKDCSIISSGDSPLT
jgi:diketogulonate reductase-like aldo/keto reductase